jgi:predicted esterase
MEPSFLTRQPRALALLLALLGLGGWLFATGPLFAPAPAPMTAPLPAGAELRDEPEYLLYRPGHLDGGAGSALVVALSPSGDAAQLLAVWQPIAERHQWFVYASKTVRNGQAYDQVVQGLVRDVKALLAREPIDPKKVVISGFSGGAMASHFFVSAHPELFQAVVLNTGMMPEYFTPDGSTLRAPFLGEAWPRAKRAVFLASPTDFRYGAMQEDRAYLERHDWQTLWLEFPGGHTLAPEATWALAADWLDSHW